jgi:hypothetical protein
MVGAVKSFFKYNSLPLASVPQAKSGIVYHNGDITKEEIVRIMASVQNQRKSFLCSYGTKRASTTHNKTT